MLCLMPMKKVDNSRAKDDVVEKETTNKEPFKKMFKETSQVQPTEEVQVEAEIESDIKVEDAGKQQQQQQTLKEEQVQEQVEP